MTRLYNHWGQARGREAFCETARATLADLDTTDPVTDAGTRLAALDRPFAPPFLQVDASVFGSPPVQLASR